MVFENIMEIMKRVNPLLKEGDEVVSIDYEGYNVRLKSPEFLVVTRYRTVYEVNLNPDYRVDQSEDYEGFTLEEALLYKMKGEIK